MKESILIDAKQALESWQKLYDKYANDDPEEDALDDYTKDIVKKIDEALSQFHSSPAQIILGSASVPAAGHCGEPPSTISASPAGQPVVVLSPFEEQPEDMGVYENFVKATTVHSTGKEKGLKWVSVLERLPDENIKPNPIVRWQQKFGDVIDGKCSYLLFVTLKHYAQSPNKYFHVEWLDESIEGEDRDKKLASWKKEYEAMRLDNFRQSKEIERLKGLIEVLQQMVLMNEQEVDRLKGLIKGLFATSRHNANQWSKEIITKQWDFYKRENNL